MEKHQLRKVVLGTHVSKEQENDEIAIANTLFDRAESFQSKSPHEQMIVDILLDAKIKVIHEPYAFQTGNKSSHKADLFPYELRVNGAIPVLNPHYVEHDRSTGIAAHDLRAIHGFTTLWCADGGVFRHYFVTTETRLSGKLVEGLDGSAGEVWYVRNGFKTQKEREKMEKPVLKELIKEMRAKSSFKENGREDMIEALRMAIRLDSNPELRSRVMVMVGLEKNQMQERAPILTTPRIRTHK